MPVDEKRRRLAFQRLDRQLSRLVEKPAPENVHKFRTSARRIEAIVANLIPDSNRNNKKLLKGLARLRKKAGRVRDLDVQIGNLRSLKVPADGLRKSQLLQLLCEDRQNCERKLQRLFAKKTVRALQKRLKRAASEPIPADHDPLLQALSQLSQLNQERTPLAEKTLHSYRVVGKRARYLAEVGDRTPENEKTISSLKHMQDVIGDWHDWLKLTARAEKALGEDNLSVLVSALRNITRAKFRQAVDVLEQTRTEFSRKKPTVSVSRRAKTTAA